MLRQLSSIGRCVLLLSSVAAAQTSNLTATITDPDGQTWNNGNFSIVFIPTPGVPGPYTWSVGTPLPIRFSGTMNGSGTISVSLPDNNFIAPRGSQWQFTLCSNTSAPCQNVVFPVTGAAPNLSGPLSAPLISPRFSPGVNAFGYLDLEVIGPPAPGAQYWNVTNTIGRTWNGSAWINSTAIFPVAAAANQTLVSTGPGNTYTVANFAPPSPNSTSYFVARACGSMTNCTQIKGDGKYVNDATSNSSTTITCPNNDCNFTQADVGKTVWATTQGTGGGVGVFTYTTYVCPITTISTVNSAQSITVGTTCTASGVANVVLYWATDDGTAMSGIDAAAGCATVVLPDPGVNGNYILTSQPFLVNPPSASVCNQQITIQVGSPAPALIGTPTGGTQTMLMISPSFAWANCKAITGASQNVCIGGTARAIGNLTILGSGLTSASNSTGCSGAANKILLSGSPTAVAMSGIDIAGICPGAAGMIGVELNAFGGNFDLGGVQEVGTIALNVHNASGVVMRQDDLHNANVSGSTGLRIENGAEAVMTGGYPIVVTSVLGKFTSIATHYGVSTNSGATTVITVGATGQYRSYGDFLSIDGGTLLGNANVAVSVASGGFAKFTNTEMQANVSSISNNGLVISAGGNKFNGTIAGTGTWAGDGVLVGSCRGTATSSSTLGMYGLGQFATVNCTSAVVNLGVAVPIVPISGSVFGLSVHAGTGCAAANTCVFTLLKNGGATTVTCSLTGGASACIDTSHFDIPVAGDTYSVQFTTGAAETLANVTVTVIDM